VLPALKRRATAAREPFPLLLAESVHSEDAKDRQQQRTFSASNSDWISVWRSKGEARPHLLAAFLSRVGVRMGQ